MDVLRKNYMKISNKNLGLEKKISVQLEKDINTQSTSCSMGNFLSSSMGNADIELKTKLIFVFDLKNQKKILAGN